MPSPADRGKLFRVLLTVAAAGFLAAPLGWAVTDYLERDNDFCNDCHLSPDVPLHIDIRRDFDAAPPASLASLHGSSSVSGRDDSAFRCIDCHGGHSWPGRLRVKVLASLDTFWWAVGSFEEPTGMEWPLWDEDCQKCHLEFDTELSPEWATPRFHELPLHNVDLGVDCVECHRSHESGGNPDAFYLEAVWVSSQCARCHPEFEEGSS